MREEVDVTAVAPLPGRALVRLLDRDEALPDNRSGLHVVRSRYDAKQDWEIGVLEAVGEGDIEPLSVGDHVIVRAPSGGKAGADVSRLLGERRETHIVVRFEEIVAGVDLEG